MIRATPFRALITLLITYLLSPLPLQVGSSGIGYLHCRVHKYVYLTILGGPPQLEIRKGMFAVYRA